MERSAVQWFAERISHGGLVSKKQFNELLEQANEMFEQQIIDAYDLGSLSDMQYPDPKTVIENGEHYYNVNFKQQ